MPFYPVFLDLTGRTVLVVGLGAVGKRKAAGLSAAGAHVIGVDPSGCDTRELAGVEIRTEPYRADHLAGVSLAFAAASADVNAALVADARARGIWVNSASDPTEGDFVLPAVWHDGPLTLAVSTDGASPALAATLRDKAAAALGPSAVALATLLAELRPLAFDRIKDPTARRLFLAGWGDLHWLRLCESDGPDVVRRHLLRTLEDSVADSHIDQA